ncbi:MAG TPA: hypothetical protein VLF66_02595 [Thermoanaerobaculia bacterium]|nr:hypothetical protein [Thermoanaerobaculia bacterium]
MAKTATEKPAGNVRDRVAAISDDVQGRVREMSDEVRRGAERASEEIRRGYERASQAAREGYDDASKNVRKGYKRMRKDLQGLSGDVNEYVRDNPGKSVLIAAGVGFLVGLLFRGGKEE